ncbi:MAG: DNA primase [Methanobacteriaceae archaeon]|jgi:DNA primase large subunit|uniref:DNA primase n=1 Tax=Methanobrevibacter sp. UBA417 TaxID=1915487 RepID=UPI00375AD81C|nr:DNA primase [Methanobacteriaceae archaeon]MDD4594924.1 DNA primase [Methanobacteriaceae archaeon]
MTLIPYINPLSDESLKIVSQNSNLNETFEYNNDLVDTINRSSNQNLEPSHVPISIGDLAVKRINWYIERKNNKNYKLSDYSYLFNNDILKFDVIAFHMLAQAVATKFNISSRETKLFIESEGLLILDRLNRLLTNERQDMVDSILKQLSITQGSRWTILKDIINNRNLALTNLCINNGEIILSKEDFLDVYSDKFHNRRPESMYDMLVGESLKEQIVSNMVMLNTENYIKMIKEKSSFVTIHSNIEKLGADVEKTISEEMTKYSTFYANASNFKIGKLIREAFPPCIYNTVNGVSSGGRNDAIVLLLTSFVSYARLYPGIFASEGGVKVSDIDKNLVITENEILPLIYEAADNCTPPLFEDQPQEKINIISKLGFGMHDSPDLNHEGETKWYTPMSCEKIKMHLPQLCKSDKDCKKINNPLSCYGIKKNRLIREGKIKEEEKKN